MVLIKIPLRLRWLVYSMILSVPLIGLEIALVSRAPLWDLPWKRMAYAGIAFTLVNVPLMAWLLSLRRWALYLASILGGVWIALSFGLSLRMGYPNLTFFSIFLCLILVCQLFFISQEMNQSYLDPKMSWFQGVPEFIPYLKSEVLAQSGDLEMRVSRFDLQGVFLFPVNPTQELEEKMESLLQLNGFKIRFYFRDLQIQATGKPVAYLPRASGLGVQFIQLNSDLRKELCDFQERLRGEGYV